MKQQPLKRSVATLLISLVNIGIATDANAEAASTASAPAATTKGVWEPVNYGEDLRLTDVFFVSPEIGYVSGDAGTILKTTDSGASWSAQLGGDPASEEGAVMHLRFVSPTVGWAAMDRGTLLGTRDGETWDVIGKIEEHYNDLAFTSETDGVYVTGGDAYRTNDGGRSWTKVYTCDVKLEAAAANLTCDIVKMHFTASGVGYAVGATYGGANVTLVLKTLDGGSSWDLAGTIENEYGASSGVFFVDEDTGWVHVHSGKSYATRDGGATWSGVITPLGMNIRFADPEVGWSFQEAANARVAYTTDGGRRWASRTFPLPSPVTAFSFPRRDVAYGIGGHGMIYRYRSLPASAPVSANAIAAIPMPGLDNGVLAQIEQLETGLNEIEAAVEAAGGETEPGGEGSMEDTGAANSTGDASDSPEDAGAGSDWSNAAVDEQLEQMQGTIDTVATGVPEMGRKLRSLNLVVVGLKLLSDLTGQSAQLKEAFVSLRDSPDSTSASAALQTLHGQLDAMKASVESFQSTKSGN